MQGHKEVILLLCRRVADCEQSKVTKPFLKIGISLSRMKHYKF